MQTLTRKKGTCTFYGTIARLWFGPVLVVVIADQDNIANEVKYDKLCSRGYLSRKSMEKFFRHGLLCSNGVDWQRHRKIVSSAPHISFLEMFVENFAKNTHILANKLKALADGITEHDVPPYFLRCSLDIIYQTSSRININAQTGNDQSTLINLTTIIDTAVLRYGKPWFLIDWIFNATELGKKYNEAVKCEHDKIIKEIVKK